MGWSQIAVPAAVFVAGLIATLWLRRMAYRAVKRWAVNTEWQGHRILQEAARGASVLWCVMLSALLALAVSAVSARWKGLAANVLWTLLLLSLALSVLSLADSLIQLYGEKLKASQRAVGLGRNSARLAILVVAALILLDIWGAPVNTVLLVIALAALFGALALRETLPNLLAGLQINTKGDIKAGDYVKLENGQEGYIRQVTWTNTQVETSDASTILVPNRKLVQSTVINYGRPLKKATEPFRFFDRAHLKELTGLKATGLRELADILKSAPDSVIYYHTHHFIEEHHYLTPEPANDFAIWVTDALGEEALGERLANIDAFEFPTLQALRDRIVGVLEERLSAEPEPRQAPEGREFHFMKSVSMILPTPYVARDLREFVEALRKLSLGSLYFHIFEARLRLGRASNDFSVWLEDSLNEPELAEQMARFDPYNYTLEATRSLLIQLIEKRIK